MDRRSQRPLVSRLTIPFLRASPEKWISFAIISAAPPVSSKKMARSARTARNATDIGVVTSTAPHVPPRTINAAVTLRNIRDVALLENQPTEDSGQRDQDSSHRREIQALRACGSGSFCLVAVGWAMGSVKRISEAA